MMRTCRVI